MCNKVKNFSYTKFSSYIIIFMALFLLSGLQEAVAVICPPDDPPPCIESSDITDGTITAADIAAGTITGGDVANGTITGADVTNGTIADPDLGTGAVRGRALAPGAVTSPAIADGTIADPDLATGAVARRALATGAVTSPAIADGTITDPDLATGAIARRALATGAVTSLAIEDGTITSADLGPTAVGNSQLQENITLGVPGDDGDLVLKDASAAPGVSTVTLDGQSGSATQALSGNGFVKAWALLDFDGTLINCYKCDPTNTFRNDVGLYIVDFTPLAADIRFRPRSATLDNHDSNVKVGGEISISIVAGTGSQLIVDTANSDGSAADKPFTVLVY